MIKFDGAVFDSIKLVCDHLSLFFFSIECKYDSVSHRTLSCSFGMTMAQDSSGVRVVNIGILER